MKLKLTYSPEELEAAAAVKLALIRLFPRAKVRRDKSKAPNLCVYIVVKSDHQKL